MKTARSVCSSVSRFIMLVYVSLIPASRIATYAGDWQLYGTFSAEAPVDDAQDGEDGGRMQE